MKIVRTDAELHTPRMDSTLEALGHELVLLNDDVSEDALCEAVADAHLLLMCYTPITKKVIESARSLKGIVKYGVGIDAIDIETAKKNNVSVVNIPEYAEETVAEGAFTLMIALAKNLLPLDRHMKSNGWAWPEPTWLGSDIAGKTVGLVGFGKIGRSMARMAGQGFRARVIAYSPHTAEEDMIAANVEKMDSLHDLLQQSDFVSIHCVLNNETHRMIGANEIRAMKPSAFLVNVSRGAIVDEQALVTALNDGQIAGAGLDVFSEEPLSLTGHRLSSLYAHPNVILSPHLTFYTREAMDRLETETLERCLEVLHDKDVLVKSADERLQHQGGKVIYS